MDWTPGTFQFLASIELDGDLPGAVRPWHVHFGTCLTGGGIVGPPADYPPLTIAGNGSASADASIDFELGANASYHVNVHLSPDEMGTLIACGDLTQGNGGAGGSAGAGGTGGVAGAAGAGGAGAVGTGGSY